VSCVACACVAHTSVRVMIGAGAVRGQRAHQEGKAAESRLSRRA
jgi:hypothetical protein